MGTLLRYWNNLRGTFWFVPSLIIAGSVLLAFVMVDLESSVDPEVLARFPRVFVAGADGARSVLVAISGSMVTVAGLVFSITLVALSLASSQYSSRVLRNFMLDRVNQIVLGVFLGIFAYCLVVLRTVRGLDDNTFVPSIAVLGGLVLGMLGIAMLVFYIHHISVRIQASHITYVVYKESRHAIEHLFPDDLGDEEREQADEQGRRWYAIPAIRTGYAQGIAAENMLAYAGKHDVVLRMEAQIGDFLIEGKTILSVLAAETPSAEQQRTMADFYITGRQRTVDEDAAFGFRQLVDVALKALSPGVNDTTTAEMCVNHLTALLVRLANRRIESDLRGEDGKLRVIAQGPTFEGLIALAFDQIRESGEGNCTILMRLLWSIETVAAGANAADRREALLQQVQSVAEAADRTIKAPVARARVSERAKALEKLLDAGSKVA